MPRRARASWQPRASAPELGGAIVASAGLLSQVLPALSSDMHGWRLLAGLVLGALGACLAVEAVQRRRTNAPWVNLVAAAALVALVATALLPFAAPSTGSAATLPVVRTSVVEPAAWQVAFPTDIGLPSAGTQWAQLHARGGIDLRQTDARLTLSNPSRSSMTITDIRPQIVDATKAPAASIAFASLQGETELRRFVTELDSQAIGSTAPLLAVPAHRAGFPAGAPPWFERHYITLAPGEIYEAKVSVITGLPVAAHFRFVISGNSPKGAFTVRTHSPLVVSGLGWDQDFKAHYAHRYVFDYCQDNRWTDATHTTPKCRS
jgi:hypothetical protein